MSARICLPLALDDAMRLERQITHTNGPRRRWLLAEMRILLGRLDRSDHQVATMLRHVDAMEEASC